MMDDENLISKVNMKSEEISVVDECESSEYESDFSDDSHEIILCDKSKYIHVTIKLDIDIEDGILDDKIVKYLSPKSSYNAQTVLINYHINKKGIKTKHVHVAVGYNRDKMGKNPLFDIKNNIECMLRIIYPDLVIKDDYVMCLFRHENGLGRLVDYMYKNSSPEYPKYLCSEKKGITTQMFHCSINSLVSDGKNKYYKVIQSTILKDDPVVIIDGLIVSGGEGFHNKISGLVNSWFIKEGIKKNYRGYGFRKYKKIEDNTYNISLWKTLRREGFYSLVKEIVGPSYSFNDIEKYVSSVYDVKHGSRSIPHYMIKEYCYVVVGGKLFNIYNKEKKIEYSEDTEPVCIFDRDIPSKDDISEMKNYISELFPEEGRADMCVSFLEALGSLLNTDCRNRPIILTGKCDSDAFELIPLLLCYIFDIDEIPLTKKGVDISNLPPESPILLIRDSGNIFNLNMIREGIKRSDIHENEGKYSINIINERPSYVIKNNSVRKPINIKKDTEYITYVCSLFNLLTDNNQYVLYKDKKQKVKKEFPLFVKKIGKSAKKTYSLDSEGLKLEYNNLILPKPSKLKEMILDVNSYETYEQQHDCIFKHCFPNKIKEYNDYLEMEKSVRVFNYTCTASEELKECIKEDRSGFALTLLYLIIDTCEEGWRKTEGVKKLTASEFFAKTRKIRDEELKTANIKHLKSSKVERSDLEDIIRNQLIAEHYKKTPKDFTDNTDTNIKLKNIKTVYDNIYELDGEAVADVYANNNGLVLEHKVHVPSYVDIMNRVNLFLRGETIYNTQCDILEKHVTTMVNNIEEEKVNMKRRLEELSMSSERINILGSIYNEHVGVDEEEMDNKLTLCVNIIGSSRVTLPKEDEHDVKHRIAGIIKKGFGSSKYDILRSRIYTGGIILD